MGKKSKTVNYVNNKEFSKAVVEYVNQVNEAKKSNSEIPRVPNYIAECFMKIANGLAHKGNFIGYSYRDEMVMDAVENCLKAINNYNIDAATKTGTPNAFSYFTTISWYAFLRRIAKEKKQQEIKTKILESSSADTTNMVHFDRPDQAQNSVVLNFIQQLKTKIDQGKEPEKSLLKVIDNIDSSE